MKSLIILTVSGFAGVAAGFTIALFVQALGDMSREEEARREYLTDPWDFGDPHDVFVDDELTKEPDCQ